MEDKDEPEIPPVSPAIKAEMEKRYAPEINFYRFVAERLERQVEDLKDHSTK